MNEKKTENIIRKHFEKFKKYGNDYTAIIHEQIPDNPKIKKLLSNASKSGNGVGKPEFIISFNPPYSDFLIIVECKADLKKHESQKKDKPKDYAVDGVKHYSSYLSKEYDVLSIAASGEKKSDIKISQFLQLKGEVESKNFASNILLSIDDYIRLYNFDPTKEKRNFDKLLGYSSELNNKLRALDLSESHRPLLVSGILIALEDPSFRESYSKEDRPSDLATLLVNSIEKIFDKQNIQGFKKDNMRQSYGFIKTHSRFASPEKDKKGNYNSDLRDLIDEIEIKVFSFTKTYQYYDVLGKFYSEFLRYANGDKTLGIVLTPQHITDLFVDLAEINEKSIVYDNCCGTGGFLISAMKKMINLCNGNSKLEKIIYASSLYGAESNSNMFSLACSNMMLRGDGKSNIFYKNCFDIVDSIKEFKPTAGLLNPPYSKRGEAVSEWDFIINNLNCLETNSLCIALIPISCVIEDPLKRKILDNHTLEAVMSMPEDLFHDSDAGTVTVTVVIRAHKPHPRGKKTWFGYWRNDGFVKRKKLGRVDESNRWAEIKNYWLRTYQNKEVVPQYSVMKEVNESHEWCVEAYLETDYSEITEDEYLVYLKKFLAFNLLD